MGDYNFNDTIEENERLTEKVSSLKGFLKCIREIAIDCDFQNLADICTEALEDVR